MALPAPFGPTWWTFSPIARNTGSTAFKASASPPTMNASLPSLAGPVEPDTVASRNSTPFSRAAAAMLFEAAIPTVLQSIKVMPGWEPSSTPPGPRTASSSWRTCPIMVMTTSAWLAAWRQESATGTPRAANRSVRPGSRSYTATGKPALSRFSVIGVPMAPMPMNAIRSAGCVILTSVVSGGGSMSGGRGSFYCLRCVRWARAMSAHSWAVAGAGV